VGRAPSHRAAEQRHSDVRQYRFYEPDEVESLLVRCGFHAITVDVSSDRTAFVSAER
jgi:hypothetical protein